jgi:hypothetical protein
MLAIGCLLPLVLVLAGSGIGVALGSTVGGIWGGAAGLVIGCAGLLAMLWGLERIKHR